tara:strand:+ start:656 stop:1447 length:792 start_codon:yes stop_codon:yes gene_type:complete
MTSILDKIYEYKKIEVRDSYNSISINDMIKYAGQSSEVVRSFSGSIRDNISAGKISLICEIKKASPSKGVLKKTFDVAKIAMEYSAAGATCISVLTDGPSFMGSNEHLTITRKSSPLPLLRKDFFIDPYQVYETKYLGGDCILIILSMLSDAQAHELYQTAQEIELDSIFEVHNDAEFERALRMKAKIIGINNRNLHTFKTDINTTVNLATKFNNDVIFISESGIYNNNQIKMLSKKKVNAFLVGESIIKSDNMTNAIKDLLD